MTCFTYSGIIQHQTFKDMDEVGQDEQLATVERKQT